MNKIDLPKDTDSNDWRIGQTMFNFLEWLRTNKNFDTSQSVRMADPFYIEDKELTKLYKEYLNEQR